MRSLLIAGLCGLAACSAASPASPASPASDAGSMDAAPGPASEPVTLLATFDLPRGSATHGLSGATWDDATRTLFIIQDTAPSIVPLRPNDDFTAWTVGTPILVTGAPDTAWDGEAIVRTADGFDAVTNETTPSLVSLDLTGKVTKTLPLPARFAAQAKGNKGLESLTLSARYLFTANEGALSGDGVLSTKANGTTVRILRRELATGATRQIAYRTEPLGAGSAAGDMGVSDLAALGDDDLLVLERGFQTGYGNTVRIFRIAFTGADVTDATLGPSTTVVSKTLLVDVGTLSADVTHPGVEPNPILDNYEALALGPTLADGRRILFLVSDDNASTEEVARILVLGLR